MPVGSAQAEGRYFLCGYSRNDGPSLSNYCSRGGQGQETVIKDTVKAFHQTAARLRPGTIVVLSTRLII